MYRSYMDHDQADVRYWFSLSFVVVLTGERFFLWRVGDDLREYCLTFAYY